MREYTCFFAGHSDFVYGDEVRGRLYKKCAELVCCMNVKEFLVGNYGSFDRLAASVVRNLKEEYGVKLTLVIPYLTKEINEYREQFLSLYDEILTADIPENTPRRFHIQACGRYMADSSSYMIAYVSSPFGGAAKLLGYAARASEKRRGEGQSGITVYNLAVPENCGANE